MPENWITYKFQELLAEPVRNGIYKKKEFHGRGARIVNMGELFRYPRLKDVDMKRVELKDKEVPKVLLEEGDLIFARRSLTAEGAGKCSIVKEILEPTTFESSIIRARPNRKKADSDFLYYFYNSSIGKNLLGTILRQVAVSGITGSDLIQLGITVPEIKEQRAIASILSALDDKIENNLAMNKTLEEMAMALYKHWFVDFGPFADCEFVDSELGMIPKGWETKGLDDLSEIHNAKRVPLSTKQRSTRKGIFPYYGASGIIDWIDDYKFDGEFVIISEDGENLRSRKTPIAFRAIGKFWVNNHAHILKGKANGINDLVICHFTNLDLNPFITGAVQPKLSKQNLLQVKIPFPLNVEIVDSVLREFELLSRQVISNNSENQTLTHLRDTLLPKLISGEVRLKEFEETIANVL